MKFSKYYSFATVGLTSFICVVSNAQINPPLIKVSKGISYLSLDFRKASSLPTNLALMFADYPVSEDLVNQKNIADLEAHRKAMLASGNIAGARYEALLDRELGVGGYFLRSGLKKFKDGLPLPETLMNPGLLWHFINRSDDTDTYMVWKLTGLKPNTLFSVRTRLLVNSDGTKCAGVGGNSGAVYFDSVVFPSAPKRFVDSHKMWRLQFPTSSLALQKLGTLDGVECGSPDDGKYTRRVLGGEAIAPAQGKTDASGNLNIVIRSHSGHEGPATFSIDRVDITFAPSPIKIPGNPFAPLSAADLPQPNLGMLKEFIASLTENLSAADKASCISGIKDKGVKITDQSTEWFIAITATKEQASNLVSLKAKSGVKCFTAIE